MHAHTFLTERIETETGAITLVTDADGRVRALDWNDHRDRMNRLLARYWGPGTTLAPRADASAASHTLEAYFAGDLGALSQVEVVTGGTTFQRAVWTALRTIPPGATLSYSALAAAIGRPRAVRAVGLANGANPIGIVVPCHRVVGVNGSLTGYAGGLERKHWLLAHEQQPGARVRRAS